VTLGLGALATVVEVLVFGRLDLARGAVVEGLVLGLVVARWHEQRMGGGGSRARVPVCA